jgi:hypothetical protein
MTPAADDITKPTSTAPNGLLLEAWSQGFMVGALLIMAGITVSNMRRGVLLHKLILIEVRSLSELQKIVSTNTVVAAYFRNAAWYFHISRTSCLRLVSLSDCDIPKSLMDHA